MGVFVSWWNGVIVFAVSIHSSKWNTKQWIFLSGIMPLGINNSELNGDITDLPYDCRHYENTKTNSSSCNNPRSLTDTSRGPHYHLQHLLKPLSLRKRFSVDFHFFSTALRFRADRHTAAGLLPPHPRRCGLVWQSTQTGRDGEVEFTVCGCVCATVRWGVHKNLDG